MNPYRRLMLFRASSKTINPNILGNIWGEYIFNEFSTLTIPVPANNLIDTIAGFRGSPTKTPFIQHTTALETVYTPNYFNGRAVATFNTGGSTTSGNYLLASGAVCWSSSGMTILWAGVLTATAYQQVILGKFNNGTSGSFFFSQSSTGSLTFSVVNVSGVRVDLTATGVPTNQFIVVGCTYDGVKMRIYCDGLEIGNIGQTGVIFNYTGSSLIMGNHSGLNSPFTGPYGHLLIYNQPLTAAQMRACTGNYMNPYWGITNSIMYDENFAPYFDETGNYYFNTAN